ncbi:MAG: transcription-repair coupling factor [Actinobacteria bacterium]|nr:transcription-repair coupling factor [Actinomycetota bacterium]
MALSALLELAQQHPPLRALAASLSGGEPVEAYASSPVRPYLLAALLEDREGPGERPALIVTADDRSARDLASDLGALVSPRRVHLYPSRGTGYLSHVAPPPHLAGLRVAAISALAGQGEGAAAGAPVVVASAVALAEAVPDPELRPDGLTLHAGESVDLGDVAALLAGAGYERVEQVEERGQFAIRGDILDAFPATEERAVRVELFGDEIESLRWFSTFTQRSLGDAERVELAPAAELGAEHREPALLADPSLDPAAADAKRSTPAEDGGPEERPDLAELIPIERFRAPLDLVSDDAFVAIAQREEIPGALRDHWEDVTAAMHDDDARRLYVEVSDRLEARAVLRLSGADAGQQHSLRAQRAEFPSRTPAEAEAELEKLVRSGYRAVVAFERGGEADRARYNLARLEAPPLRDEAPAEPGVSFAEAHLREGFLAPELKLALIPYSRLVHRKRAGASAAPGAQGRRLAAAIELRVGDLVVHEDHGVARFSGFDTKTLAGVTRDYLELSYKGSDKVFAPTDQLAKISRFVGADGSEAALSALGGKRWSNMKARARRAAQEMAGELLNLYAERQVRRGHAFSPDGEWQLGFEAAFPHRETADQLEAIDAVKADMEGERPMDRLICGDVGYGKTEVAMRAAHKAAVDGKQVMMLVPTTILAQQHFGTFRERMADTAFTIEMVSRLRKPAEVKDALERFSEGRVDILIGTHRLLSRDVRGKDLGLIIVDEEQRFGVKQKELLRQLKLKVDVLSMSATPIPRTLQMSLAGLRDITVIETPPEGRRPVRTYVGPYDDELVGRAIRREVERGGQAFFLHNRIESLHEVAEGLRALCPGVRFAEAHGQMDELELESTMLSFVRGEHDCLVATTIIESGLDIPSANTLIVERADQVGLAQAYQIRGRVGRSRERAYAYLLYPSPEALTADAAARLATLSDNTELGSGFRVAMRDLEIRGAGNLLGDEQSGHVAAVGFELYCQMLEDATEELRAAGEGDGLPPEREPVRLELDLDAYVPAGYVPFEAAKIDLHRRIAAAREPGELRALGDELRDRFGPPPEPVENLIAMQRVRIELGALGASAVEFKAGRLRIAPIELDSERAAALRERAADAIYEWRQQTVAMPVPDDPAARLAALLALTEAVSASAALAPA